MKHSRRMAGIKCVVFLVVLTFQWTFIRGDTEVSCSFMERCMLPCSYGGTAVVIHWIQVSAGDITVHSFYHNQEQLKDQNQRFRGRTSLFNDQISTGNASLQLTKVEVQDEGKYKCYISTDGESQSSFINLKIRAPVKKSQHSAASVFRSNTETTILCPPSDAPFSYLIWRFNHSQSIVTRSGADISYTVYAGWEQHVKHVSESGSITLQDLTADHEGIYTCELSDAEETKVSENEIMMMTTDQATKKNDGTQNSTHLGAIAAPILCSTALLCLILYSKCK
uniref:Ig-like domain-containing protein n=1 Tax=Oreochromis aureus TaxID=47969 RepID=A0AAZ1X8W3_OREAU